MRSGTEGVSKSLEILAVVSAACHEEEVDFRQKQFALLKASGSSPTVQRFYDATPVRLRFGRLQPDVMEHARYAYFGTDKKWHLVPFREWLQKVPNASPSFGTLELLAQGATVTCRAKLVRFSLSFPPARADPRFLMSWTCNLSVGGGC